MGKEIKDCTGEASPRSTSGSRVSAAPRTRVSFVTQTGFKTQICLARSQVIEIRTKLHRDRWNTDLHVVTDLVWKIKGVIHTMKKAK